MLTQVYGPTVSDNTAESTGTALFTRYSLRVLPLGYLFESVHVWLKPGCCLASYGVGSAFKSVQDRALFLVLLCTSHTECSTRQARLTQPPCAAMQISNGCDVLIKHRLYCTATGICCSPRHRQCINFVCDACMRSLLRCQANALELQLHL